MSLKENLLKSAQCADLLLSDIRQAHGSAVKHTDPLCSHLAHTALLELFYQANAIKVRLEAISEAAGNEPAPKR